MASRRSVAKKINALPRGCPKKKQIASWKKIGPETQFSLVNDRAGRSGDGRPKLLYGYMRARSKIYDDLNRIFDDLRVPGGKKGILDPHRGFGPILWVS